MAKKAVVLFNLGGPDNLESVPKFLFNLFNDKYIINLPQPIRFLLATWIAKKRAPKSKEIYRHIDNRSPILEITKKQGELLQLALQEQDGENSYQVFVFMRYWHPMVQEVVKLVRDYHPEEIILLPLYPQYSTTTTLSAIQEWRKHWPEDDTKVKVICCYYDLIIKSYIDLIKSEYEKAKSFGEPLIIFSAHSLPVSIVHRGDPYVWQTERTVQMIIEQAGFIKTWALGYQSKVGNQVWVGPNTETFLRYAKQRSVPVVLVPISFVSEHSETLVELDIDYRQKFGNDKLFFRAPAQCYNQHFIDSLTKICLVEPTRQACPQEWCQCFLRLAEV